MSEIIIAFISCGWQGKNVQEVVLATIVEARRKLKYDIRGQQQKVVMNFMKSHFITYQNWGGCYSGQALVCVILVARRAL